MEEKVRLKDGRERRGSEMVECLAAMAKDKKNQDCKLRCKEGKVVSSVRILLALAYPTMMEVLKEREDDEEELVLILPDFQAEEVNTRFDDLFRGKIKLEVPVKKENVELDLDAAEDVWSNAGSDVNDNLSVHNDVTYTDAFFEDQQSSHNREYKIEEDETICPYCGNEFPVTSSLRKHISLKHKRSNHRQGSVPKLHHHVIEEQKDKRKPTKGEGRGGTQVTCDDCGKSLLDKATLAKHKGTRNCLNGKIRYVGKLRTNCSFCALEFPTTKEYQDHRPLHRKGKLWKCLESECGKTFELPRVLRYHMKKHRGEFCHTCTQCGKKLVTKKGLEVHIKMHNGEFNYSCDDCGKKFVTEKHFQQHQLSHKPPSFACDQCGNMYIDKPRLKRHMRAKHLMDENGKRIERKIEELMCHLCSWTIRTKWGKEALTKHIKRKHLGIVFPTYPTKTPPKLLTCQNCGYITDSSNQLRAHQASSRCDPNKLLNKSFRCSKCNKGFTTEKSLRKHEQEHITGKPHKCDNCGLGFTERWNLTKHIRKGTCKGARGSREHEIYAN